MTDDYILICDAAKALLPVMLRLGQNHPATPALIAAHNSLNGAANAVMTARRQAQRDMP